MDEGAKNANDEMFRRAVSSNFATVINKLQRIIELLEAQAAQQSVHLTVLPVREIETVCPHCSLVFDVPVPEPHSK